MAEAEMIISSSSSSSGKLKLGSGSCPIPFLLLHCADANSSVRFWQPHHWLQHLEGSRLIIHQEDYPSDQMFVTLASSAQVAPPLSCVLQCTLPISCLPKNATDGNVELLVTASTQILILEMPFSTNDSMSLSLNVCLGVSGRLLPLPTNLFEDLLLGIEQQNKDFLRGQLSVPRTTTLVVGSTGSGKSSIVRAVATSMKISVLSIGAAQLFARGKQYCDRLLFEMLNAALVLSPCILLLEDIHAFAPRKVLDSSYSAYFEVLQTFLSRLLQNLLPSTSGLWVVATCEKEELLDKHILSLFPDICRIDKMSESNRNKLSTSTGKFYFEALMQKHQGNDKLSNETSRPLEKESEVGTSLVGMCGALASFRQMCIWPRLYRTFYERLGMQRGPSHVLFLGPSGSGKTMAARHLATTHNFALVEMSLSTVMRSDVGGSEKQIRNIFSEAKARSPSLLLIDEFEAMFGSNDEGNSSSQSTLVSTLISCLDDITEWNQAGGTEAHVFVVATSRSPSDIDSRFLQVGRLSSGIFFGPLAVEESKAFLDVILQSLNLGFEVDSDEVHNLVKKTKAWTGSDFHLLHKRVLFDLAEKRVASPKELVSVLEGHIYAQLPTCRQEDVDEILSWTTQHRSFVVANLPKQSSD